MGLSSSGHCSEGERSEWLRLKWRWSHHALSPHLLKRGRGQDRREQLKVASDRGTSLAVQWSSLCFECSGYGLHPWLGTEIPPGFVAQNTTT